MKTDHDGQPVVPFFNQRRNRDKSIFSLLGLCRGLTADKKINPQETLFLDAWLRNNCDIANDPDVIDITDLLTDILKDGIATQDELDDLQGLLQSISRHRSEFGSSPDEINKLLAVLRGITADRQVNNTEIEFIQNWISANPALSTSYPGDVLIARIQSIFADGIVSEPERLDLLETLDQINGDRFEETGLAYGLSTEFGTQEVERLEHAGKAFCFTGKFIAGPRVAIEQSAVDRGAIISARITRKLDVLVIGTIASRDWRFSSHGRKIEQAIELQRSGHPLLILTERHWREHL